MAGPFLKPTSPLDRQTLGKYALLCRLTTGGMSEIFLATQSGLAGFRKIVVLKSILPNIRGEEAFVRMFLEEARITSSFNHPNIAQVFDLDTDDDKLFLAMEFVQGATLSEVTRACEERAMGLPIGFGLTAVRDTALALHYAHTFSDVRGRKQPVIHRDVSGKNIMVTFDGTPKLLDFGIAKSLGSYRNDSTSTGMVKGTAGYMSPEQVLGEPLDARSDIFSLGIVLHEALTGARLFARPTEEQEMRAVLNETAGPPSRANPSVSYAIDKVTLKALSPKRELRYATALEFARALEAAATGSLWHPEQLGDLVQRLHAERLAQIRELVQEAQGHTGEHASHIVESATDQHASLPLGDKKENATVPTIPARPERGVTVETPITAQPPPVVPIRSSERDEITFPEGFARAPRTPMPSQAVRMRTSGPQQPVVAAPEPGPVIGGGLPAFRPDGDLHDTGARPAARPASVPVVVHPLFENLGLEAKTSPSIESLVAVPDEPPTAIRPPRPPRTGKLIVLGVTLGLVAISAAFIFLRTRDTQPEGPRIVVVPPPPPVAPTEEVDAGASPVAPPPPVPLPDPPVATLPPPIASPPPPQPTKPTKPTKTRPPKPPVKKKVKKGSK